MFMSISYSHEVIKAYFYSYIFLFQLPCPRGYKCVNNGAREYCVRKCYLLKYEKCFLNCEK